MGKKINWNKMIGIIILVSWIFVAILWGFVVIAWDSLSFEATEKYRTVGIPILVFSTGFIMGASYEQNKKIKAKNEIINHINKEEEDA